MYSCHSHTRSDGLFEGIPRVCFRGSFLRIHTDTLQYTHIHTEHSISSEAVLDKLNRLSEVNPMLGFRGCRLGVVFPEISAMQVFFFFSCFPALEFLSVAAGYAVLIGGG